MWPRGRSGAAAALWTCLTALISGSCCRVGGTPRGRGAIVERCVRVNSFLFQYLCFCPNSGESALLCDCISLFKMKGKK